MLEPEIHECTQRIAKDPSGKTACRIGAANGQPSVVIWGDSHARSLVSALDDALREKGLAGTNLTFPDCPPVLEMVPERDAPLQRICEPFRQAAYERIVRDNSIKTVIVAARWSAVMEGRPYDNGEGGIEYWDNARWHPAMASVSRKAGLARAIRRTLEGLVATGKEVILVYPVPEVAWNVPYHAAKAIMRGSAHGDLTTSFDRFKERNRSVYEALDNVETRTNLERIKPAEIFCDTFSKGRCVAQLRGVPLYSDDDHLTRESARMVVEKMMPHIDDASAAAWTARRRSD